MIQLCVYAELLEQVQGEAPPRMHVVLGNGVQVSLRTADVRHYYGVARRRFEAFAAAPPAISVAEPCGHCALCRVARPLRSGVGGLRAPEFVAGITRAQMSKLRLGEIPRSAPWRRRPS